MLLLDTPLQGAIFVCGVMLVSVLILLLVRRYADIAWLKRQHEVASFYFLMIGTLYAVLIAFAIFVVWTQFQDAGNNLENEVNEVGDLSRMSLALPDPAQDEIRAALLNYIHAVLEDEFPAMAEGHESSRTWEAIEKLWRVYENVELPAGPKADAFYRESLIHLNGLSNYRRNRLFTSRGTVPQMLWYLLIIGGILLVAFTYCFGHDSLWSQSAMTAAMSGLLAFSLFLVLAYDSPYAGAARVSQAPYLLELDRVTARR